MKFFKSIILVTVVLISLPQLQAQNKSEYFKVYPVIDKDMPTWAVAMYQQDPNVFEVQQLQSRHFESYGFHKNIHTQNYKHWIRQIREFVNEQGLIREENLEERKQRISLLSAKRSTDQKKAIGWTALGPFETYIHGTTIPYSLQTNVYSLDIYPSEPNLMVCGSETGTVFYTSDQGINWTSISDHAEFSGGITAVKIHPLDPQHFFAGVDSRIYETRDGGQSWNENYFLDGSPNEFVFNPDNAEHIFCSASNGLYETLDGGINWQKIYNEFCYDLAFHPTDNTIIYALVLNATRKRPELIKSTDGGLSWQLKEQGWYQPADLATATVNGGKIAVTQADHQRVYACLIGDSKSGDNGWIGVYRSDDEAESWYNPSGQDGSPYDNINSGRWNVAAYADGYHQGFYNFDLEASPVNPDLIWVGTIRLSESSDGGYNFRAIGAANSVRLDNQHADIQDIEVLGNEVWVASDGGINYSNDNLSSGTSRKNGINGADFWGFGSGWNEDILVGGKYHNGNSAFYQSYDHGIFHHVGGVEESTGYVHPLDSRKAFFNKYWAGGTETVIIPDRLGAAARYQGILPYIPNESYTESWSSGFFFDPRYANHIFMGEGSIVWKSVNGGNYFEALHDFGTDRRVLEIKISRDNPNVLYTVVGGPGYWDQSQLFRSEDGGITWQQMAGLGTSMWRVELSLNPENANEVWASTTNGNDGQKVFQSLDGGMSWMNKTTPALNGERIRDILFQGGTQGVVYVASQYNIHRFDPDTQAWNNISEGLPFVSKGFEMRPFYKDQKLRIATYGKGIWELPLETYSQPVVQPMTHVREIYCSRDTVQFDCYSILDHSDASWEWNFDPQPLFVSDYNARNPKVVLGANGSYDVSLSITDKNGKRSEKLIPAMVEVMSYCNMDEDSGLAMATYDNGDYAQTADFNREVTEFTVTAWVKPDGIQNEYTGIFMNDGTAGGFNFKNANNNLAYHWPGGAWWWDSGLIVRPNEWSHVAMVVNPQSVTLYVNGIPSIHNIQLDPLQLGTCKIGSYQGWDGRNYKGIIDELAVWDRALSTDEIRRYRHLTKQDFQSDPNLLAYYQFNAPTPDVMDRVSGHHASLSRGAEKRISNGPFGSGSASSKDISTAGLYDYQEEGLSLSFEDVLLPEGEVYVSKIRHQPNILPDNNSGSDAYWIINNYGPRTVFDAATEMRITPDNGAPSNNEINDPQLIQLYGRTVNDDLSEWNTMCNASSADDQHFYFSDDCQVRIEGQLYYSSADDGTTNTEDELQGAVLMPKIYPNPISSDEHLIIKNNHALPFKIKIYDQKGLLVMTKNITPLSEIRISMESLASGIYFYKLANHQYLFNGNFVVTD